MAFDGNNSAGRRGGKRRRRPPMAAPGRQGGPQDAKARPGFLGRKRSRAERLASRRQAAQRRTQRPSTDLGRGTALGRGGEAPLSGRGRPVARPVPRALPRLPGNPSPGSPQPGRTRGRLQLVTDQSVAVLPQGRSPARAQMAVPRAGRRSGVRRKGPGDRPGRSGLYRQRRPPRKPRPLLATLRYVLRLLIVGVGLGVLAGTVLSSIDPSLKYSAESETEATSAAQVQSNEIASPKAAGLRLGAEMSGLRNQLETRIAANTGLTAGVFIVDLDTGSYLDINSRRRFSSASTIKLPILVALFEEVDAGNISLNEQLTMKPELIATEAGEMQFQPPGTQFSVLETATEMIRISDNTATNLLIDRLGGAARLNQRFHAWGLQQTQIQNLLPDLEGTNTISPNDLVTLMGRINQGEVVSLRSRDRLLSILRTTQTSDLLPQGIGPGAVIAHKTGNIGAAIGDVGLVDMPSGKRYIIMAMVERPHGDPRAEELIRNISADTYQFLEAAGSTSEQMQPTMPRTNIAEQEPKVAPAIMTTDP